MSWSWKHICGGCGCGCCGRSYSCADARFSEGVREGVTQCDRRRLRWWRRFVELMLGASK
jgi:hypothetical protein